MSNASHPSDTTLIDTTQTCEYNVHTKTTKEKSRRERGERKIKTADLGSPGPLKETREGLEDQRSLGGESLKQNVLLCLMSSYAPLTKERRG